MGESDERVHQQRSPGDARTEFLSNLRPLSSLRLEQHSVWGNTNGRVWRVGEHKWENVTCGEHM